MRRISPLAGVVGVVALLALVWLPGTLRGDVSGARADRGLTAQAASFARGPAAKAGTDLALVRAALAEMPSNASFSIVRGGRWGSANHPNPKTRFVWEAGESWTQYVLAPRLETAPTGASWLLLRDTTPGAAGIAHPLGAWRFGTDWLVRLR